MHILCPWVTPKVFPDLDHPEPRVKDFFDHYDQWFRQADEVVLNFCAGNGDHVLNYRGPDGWDDTFDWARYSCYNGAPDAQFNHNLDWLKRVRDGGERSYNPYSAGPFFLLSDKTLSYRQLKNIYVCFRAEAARRGLNFKLLEYLEPGPEFCHSEWKTERHPEGAGGNADCGGTPLEGVIDVCSSLNADDRPYAAYPGGIPGGTNTGDFVAEQTAAFVRDFELDGIYLGNQFGLIGFWNPANAPEPTPERRAGITTFFRKMRKEMGDQLVYWMDTYWSADIENEKWAMSEENYALLDAVMVSNFAVISERTQVVPNIESKLRIREASGGEFNVLFSVDFVDPWYWYRIYLDDRKNFLFQHDTYRTHGALCQGVSFFANDTFGHWVMPTPLQETYSVVAATHGWE